MEKWVIVNSRDEYLVLRLQVLCAREDLKVSDTADVSDAALVIWDLDEPKEQAPSIKSARTLTVSRLEDVDADFHLPMRNAELSRLLRGEQTGTRLALSEDKKSAYLDGECIRLTEIEATLLSLLIEARGEFVSHEDAVRQIWKGEASTSAVNVYIHYLREKLERTGERIILAKRGRGYALDKKYTGGTGAC